MLTATNLGNIRGVRHGFFSRLGGVSPEGAFGSLNCGFGSDDSDENVKQNRQIVLQHIGADKGALVTAYQTHSALAIQVHNPWSRDSSPQADAMACDRRGLVLGILTADCAPVLFADEKAGVIGAAHAGWRGAHSGILEACLEEMQKLGAVLSEIFVAVGPCIAQKSYEVGVDFYKVFLDEDKDNDKFFINALRPEHYLFDLTGYIKKRLTLYGLASVESLGIDTFSNPEHYFSYRRSTLEKEKDYGRLLSVIMLED